MLYSPYIDFGGGQYQIHIIKTHHFYMTEILENGRIVSTITGDAPAAEDRIRQELSRLFNKNSKI